jgi:hypothetical protein
MPLLVAVLLTVAEDVVSSQTEHWLALMGVAYVLVALFGGARPSFRLPRRHASMLHAPEVLRTQEES